MNHESEFYLNQNKIEFINSPKYFILISLTLGSTDKKVPRRHQSLSGGSTLSAVHRKLL
jgi:hypothetical protein